MYIVWHTHTHTRREEILLFMNYHNLNTCISLQPANNNENKNALEKNVLLILHINNISALLYMRWMRCLSFSYSSSKSGTSGNFEENRENVKKKKKKYKSRRRKRRRKKCAKTTACLTNNAWYIHTTCTHDHSRSLVRLFALALLVVVYTLWKKTENRLNRARDIIILHSRYFHTMHQSFGI